MIESIYFYSFGISTFLLLLHIFIWRKFSLSTPSGAGIYLGLIYFMHSSFFGLNFIALNYILPLSIIFFLDDIIEVSPGIRILAIIFAVIGVSLNSDHITFVIGFFILVMSITLVNIVNFYDGRDLNFATLFFLNIFGWLFLSDNENVIKLGIISLLFLIPFAILNSKPNRIYIGDTGAFVLSMTLVSVIVIDISSEELNLFYLFPFILPTIDVFYVLAYRFFKGENLLSRNFYHLYQKDHFGRFRFFYIVPQIFFYFFSLFCFYLFKDFFNLNQYFAFSITFGLSLFLYIFKVRKKIYELEWKRETS